MDKTKSEAAAYAPEILMLARALNHVVNVGTTDLGGIDVELKRRLRVLLDLEEAK